MNTLFNSSPWTWGWYLTPAFCEMVHPEASFYTYSVLLHLERPEKEKLFEVASRMKSVLSRFFGPLEASAQFRAYRTKLWGGGVLLATEYSPEKRFSVSTMSLEGLVGCSRMFPGKFHDFSGIFLWLVRIVQKERLMHLVSMIKPGENSGDCSCLHAVFPFLPKFLILSSFLPQCWWCWWFWSVC